ncbi:fungal specific transcription factor domain-containing protein [Phlyctema vagabunda]|uniref:Fungal specific transcription factor domain-containing protein n=1 Tax=Phlyctema vagabunda TaxID=108571 RepID=A0ABR4PNJ9_9HELO
MDSNHEPGSFSCEGHVETILENESDNHHNFWADSGNGGCSTGKRSVSRRATTKLTGSASHNCLACYQKKTKCDRKAEGCANCSRSGVDCTYSSQKSSGPQKRGPYNKDIVRRNLELEQKITALQSTVEKLGSLLEKGKHEPVQGGIISQRNLSPGQRTMTEESVHSSTTPSRANGNKEGDGDHLLNNSISSLDYTTQRSLPSISWDDFVGKFDENISGSGGSNGARTSRDSSESSSPYFPHKDLPSSSAIKSHASLHPSAQLIREYWGIFKSKVDPLLKILHIPTIERYLLDGTGIPEEAAVGMDAVMFSIYHAAIINSPAQSGDGVVEDRGASLSKYSGAIRRILANQDTLTSSGVLPLQALVIYLYHVQPEGAQSEYLWIGTALRMAHFYGVDRDGKTLHKSPFETEMLRRLWWNIYRLERRFSEDYISHPFASEPQFDTLLPSNLNDSDISPDDTEFAISKPGRTDMTFCLVDFKISALTFNIMKQNPSKGLIAQRRRADMVREFMKKLTEEHLQYCDPENDFDFMIIAYSKLSLSRIWLLAHHPSQSCLDRILTDILPVETSIEHQRPVRNILPLALEAFEYSQILPAEPRMEPWAWFWKASRNMHKYLEFYLLAEICYRPSNILTERAWKVLGEAANRPQPFTTTTGSSAGPLDVMLSKLRTRASELRLKEKSGSSPYQPPIVSAPRETPILEPLELSNLPPFFGNGGKATLYAGTITPPITSTFAVESLGTRYPFHPIDLLTPEEMPRVTEAPSSADNMGTTSADLSQLPLAITNDVDAFNTDCGMMSEFLTSDNLRQDLSDAHLGIPPWFQFSDAMTGVGNEEQIEAGWDEIMKGLTQ